MTFSPLLCSAGHKRPRCAKFLEHFETWCCRDWLAVPRHCRSRWIPRSNMAMGSHSIFEANGHWNGKIKHVCIYIYKWGIGMGIILDTLCHMGMDQNLKSRWWFYGVKTTVPSHPRWGVHGRFVLKVPETLQRFSVSSTPSAIILAFTAGRSDAAPPFNTSSIAPISTLVTWGETRSDLRVISIWHQEGRKWGPSVMMFIYVQRIFFWIYQL